MASQRQIVRDAARRYGIDPRILWGVYGTESDYGRNPSRSSAGAEGPFQFLPSTAKGMGVDPHNFRSAAYGAARYLAQYKGRGLAGMLSAYNAGPAGALQPGYVKTVLEKAKAWGGGEPAPTSPGAAGAPGAPGQQVSVQPGQLGINQAAGPDPALIEQLSALLGKAQAPPAVAGRSGVKAPPLSAGPTLPAGAKQIAPIAPKPEAALANQIEPLLQAIMQSGGESSVTSSGPTVTSSGASPHSLAHALPRGTKLRGFLPGNAELQVNRIDQGQDLKTNAGGPILAPGSGYVIAVKTNPGGFGNNYPVVHFTSGPLAGHDVYIGHTHAAVRQGAHFPAGAVLSHTGHGTPAEGNARTPGWAEIGLWPPGNMQAGQRIAPLLGLRR